jgi:hypothetical protein
VLLVIHEHVDQTRTDLTRRPQLTRVKAITPDAAAAPDDAIECTRESHGEPLHPAREGEAIRRLDHEMNVVCLQAVLHHAIPMPRRFAEAPLHLRHDSLVANGGQEARAPERDMQGIATRVRRTRNVTDAPVAPRLRLPTRTCPRPAAPRAKAQQQLTV